MHFKCLVSVLICTFLVFGCSKSSSRKDKTGGDPKDFKERRVPRENAMISRGVGVRSNVDLMSNPPNRNMQDDAVLNLSKQNNTGNNVYTRTNSDEKKTSTGFTQSVLNRNAASNVQSTEGDKKTIADGSKEV